MKGKRKSGILCHPTSFPSRYGIGDLGEGAKKFVDFLHKGKQSLWQILPLGPTSFRDSPYQSFSSFAGNYLLISPDVLFEEGYLTKDDLEFENHFDDRKIDYGRTIELKTSIFKKAFKNYNKNNIDYLNFCNENKDWLEDYSLFVALKEYFIDKRKNLTNKKELNEFGKKYKRLLSEDMIKDYYYGAVWSTWPEALVERNVRVMNEYRSLLKEKINYQKFLQYHFYIQWQSIKNYANDKGIEIVGDIPIFVAYDSCDVWADKKIFMLDKYGFPLKVAGVPPDYFSVTGQLWGNPLYDWNYNEKTKFDWWAKRIKSNFKNMDILRIDHFRAFDTYWEIDFGAENAIKGKWIKGPGKKIFDEIEKEFGKLPIIAEDLGAISPGTEILRSGLGFPGMKILQFAFEDNETNSYLPHNYQETNTIVYTGTHDNDTTLGWYEKTSNEAKDFLRKYLNITGEDVSWDLIRLAFSSIAIFAIVPIQDIMSLDSYDRMNTPGTQISNWQFRYVDDMLLNEYSEGLNYISKLYNRN